MNKTRFQLPPRTEAAHSIDRWVIGEAAATASRRADEKSAAASGNPSDVWASIRFPFMFDMATWLAAQQRNMEAMVAAGRAVREGAQAVAQRNVEIVQQMFDTISERLEAMDVPECPKDRAMRQTETAIKAYEDAASNVRELGEIIQHANSEAMEVLNRRFTEAVDEAKSLTRYATRRFWETEEKPVPFWQPT